MSLTPCSDDTLRWLRFRETALAMQLARHRDNFWWCVVATALCLPFSLVAAMRKESLLPLVISVPTIMAASYFHDHGYGTNIKEMTEESNRILRGE